MSRPKPNVLLEFTNNVTYKCEQVLEADAIWAVFYNCLLYTSPSPRD